MLTTMLITHQSDVYRLPQVKSGNGNDIKRIFVAPHDSFLGHIIKFIAPLRGRRSKSRGLYEALILVSRSQTMYCGGICYSWCISCPLFDVSICCNNLRVCSVLRQEHRVTMPLSSLHMKMYDNMWMNICACVSSQLHVDVTLHFHLFRGGPEINTSLISSSFFNVSIASRGITRFALNEGCRL